MNRESIRLGELFGQLQEIMMKRQKRGYRKAKEGFILGMGPRAKDLLMSTVDKELYDIVMELLKKQKGQSCSRIEQKEVKTPPESS